jgi:membrane-associated PAP2 superfamily phosphatase
MKYVMTLTFLASMFIGSAFAAQVSTDCPWSNQQSRGGNTKTSLQNGSSKPAPAANTKGQ